MKWGGDGHGISGSLEWVSYRAVRRLASLKRVPRQCLNTFRGSLTGSTSTNNEPSSSSRGDHHLRYLSSLLNVHGDYLGTVHHVCRLSSCSSATNEVEPGSAQPQVGADYLALARCSACKLLHTWTALFHSLTAACECFFPQEEVMYSLISFLPSPTYVLDLCSWEISPNFVRGSSLRLFLYLDCQIEPRKAEHLFISLWLAQTAWTYV